MCGKEGQETLSMIHARSSRCGRGSENAGKVRVGIPPARKAEFRVLGCGV